VLVLAGVRVRVKIMVRAWLWPGLVQKRESQFVGSGCGGYVRDATPGFCCCNSGFVAP
jgi:hypothetical protein